jgi:hypothetical protein
MTQGWAARVPTDDGPLTGEALRRLRAADSGTLRAWIDNSLNKIGQLTSDNDRAKHQLAQSEAKALVQALSELVARSA